MSIQFLKNSSAQVRESRHGAESSIVANDWVHCLIEVPAKGETATELTISDLPKQQCSVPMAFWIENRDVLLALDYDVAVQVAGSDELNDLIEYLPVIKTM